MDGDEDSSDGVSASNFKTETKTETWPSETETRPSEIKTTPSETETFRIQDQARDRDLINILTKTHKTQ